MTGYQLPDRGGVPDSGVLSDMGAVPGGAGTGAWGPGWSDVKAFRPDLPTIDPDALHAYRLGRLRDQMRRAEVDVCVLVSPISLRYAADYRNYALFQAHIPTTYLFVPIDGPIVAYGAYGTSGHIDEYRPGRPLAPFDGGVDQAANEEHGAGLAADLLAFLSEIGSTNQRVAVEYVNPSITTALNRAGLDVIDGAIVVEQARVIKGPEEIKAIRWAVAVAELGITALVAHLRPGVTELQLWALLNYNNVANDGDWHDGRMLASGPRTNPWLQEAANRRVEAGDLVAFDTDMIGPYGYFADVSRTVYCGPHGGPHRGPGRDGGPHRGPGRDGGPPRGPGRDGGPGIHGGAGPTKAQRRLYRLAVSEIEHNLGLVRPGMRFSELQAQAWVPDEQYQANAYTCIVHGVGMCDEYPQIKPAFRGPNPYDGVIEENMVLCFESYMGAEGGTQGVKLEQQVLITADGYELLSTYPFDAFLLE